LRALQNGGSRDIDVRCPRIANDRLIGLIVAF
jgi:hypothetical protein